VIEPPHGHITATASATIAATITTASKCNIMCHMARPRGFIQRHLLSTGRAGVR
jgi:hypothetical protein